MLPLLAAVLLAGLPAETVRVPVQGVEVSVDLPSFKEDAEMAGAYRAQFGNGAVLAGSLGDPEDGVTISILAEVDRPHGTSREWRGRLTREETPPKGVEHFDCGEIACRVSKVGDADLAQVSWNAFPVAGGLCFDIHVSGIATEGEKGPLVREGFLAIVRSFRAGFFRRGGAADFPDEVAVLAYSSAVQSPGEAAWLKAECKAHPEDWARAYALGAFVQQSDPAAALASYLKALELLAKRKEPGPKEAFVRMLAEEGAALTLAKTGKPRDGVPHLRAAYDAAVASKSRFQGVLAYNLACVHGLLSEAANAVKYLKVALDLDPSFRENARKESDFDKVRAAKEFQALVGEAPAGK